MFSSPVFNSVLTLSSICKYRKRSNKISCFAKTFVLLKSENAFLQSDRWSNRDNCSRGYEVDQRSKCVHWKSPKTGEALTKFTEPPILNFLRQLDTKRVYPL